MLETGSVGSDVINSKSLSLTPCEVPSKLKMVAGESSNPSPVRRLFPFSIFQSPQPDGTSSMKDSTTLPIFNKENDARTCYANLTTKYPSTISIFATYPIEQSQHAIKNPKEPFQTPPRLLMTTVSSPTPRSTGRNRVPRNYDFINEKVPVFNMHGGVPRNYDFIDSEKAVHATISPMAVTPARLPRSPGFKKKHHPDSDVPLESPSQRTLGREPTSSRFAGARELRIEESYNMEEPLRHGFVSDDEEDGVPVPRQRRTTFAYTPTGLLPMLIHLSTRKSHDRTEDIKPTTSSPPTQPMPQTPSPSKGIFSRAIDRLLRRPSQQDDAQSPGQSVQSPQDLMVAWVNGILSRLEGSDPASQIQACCALQEALKGDQADRCRRAFLSTNTVPQLLALGIQRETAKTAMFALQLLAATPSPVDQTKLWMERCGCIPSLVQMAVALTDAFIAKLDAELETETANGEPSAENVEVSQTISHMLATLVNMCIGASHRKDKCLESGRFINRLEALLRIHKHRDVQRTTAYLVSTMAIGDEDRKQRLATPGVIYSLAALIHPDVPRSVQFQVVVAIRAIMHGSIDRQIEVASQPQLLQNLAKLLPPRTFLPGMVAEMTNLFSWQNPDEYQGTQRELQEVYIAYNLLREVRANLDQASCADDEASTFYDGESRYEGDGSDSECDFHTGEEHGHKSSITFSNTYANLGKSRRSEWQGSGTRKHLRRTYNQTSSSSSSSSSPNLARRKYEEDPRAIARFIANIVVAYAVDQAIFEVVRQI